MTATLTHSPHTPGNGRQFGLDWLRIGVFILLIFYHTGMFFNTEGWHAKSLNANDAMEPFMWLSSPWRLPLLFLISGVAMRFLSDKLGGGTFALDRLWRLFPVILFGMYVIVPPQSYSELRIAGIIEPGYWDFFRQYAGEWAGPWALHTPTWNHLWYVVYLFVYSLLLAPFFPLLRKLADSGVMQAAGRASSRGWIGVAALISLPLLPFLIVRFTLFEHFPTTHALLDDWANHANSLAMVLIGYFMAKNDGVWRTVDRALPVVGALTAVLLAYLSWAYTHIEIALGEPALLWFARLARIVFMWSIILTLLGAARRWLNHDGPVRRYLTAAVFPWYILHQTIIVIVGFAIRDAGYGVWTEFALIAGATFGGCILGFEVLRHIPVLRLVMGMKALAPAVAPPPSMQTGPTLQKL
ncbi:acyltransferase family protein [Maricaulis sp.]|uniref:acyltransferase family protein n=1 Tax=Maricaulis sp. TaxID=1486257 RepID=UPI002B268F7E|nr:acyltransferase family protein [Maricaulis sp.]